MRLVRDYEQSVTAALSAAPVEPKRRCDLCDKPVPRRPTFCDEHSEYAGAAPVAQEPVAIKPLEWEKGDGNFEGQHVWSSGDPWVFWIVKNPDSDFIWCENFNIEGFCPASPVRGSFISLEDAQAAAQADFDKRIWLSLTTPPAPAASVGAEEIARAFEAGALAVHNEWCDAIDRGESDPPLRPDFSEAAHDYATSLLSRAEGESDQK